MAIDSGGRKANWAFENSENSLLSSMYGCALWLGVVSAKGQQQGVVAEPNLQLFTVLAAVNAAGYDMEVGRQDSQFGLPLQGELRRRWLADALAGRFLSSSQLTGTVVEDLYVDPHVQRIYGDEGLTLGYSTPVRNSRGKVIAVWKNFAVWSLVEDMFHSIYAVLKKQNLGSAELSLLNSKDPSSWTMTRQSAGRLTCGATGLCPCNTCGDFSAWKPDKSPGTACFAL